tara:strand:+ start:328 stop:546 length:219 start_codon:yes stop_codon:yes gene_type:complete
VSAWEKNEAHISVVASAIHKDKIIWPKREKHIVFVLRKNFVLIIFNFRTFFRQFNLIIAYKNVKQKAITHLK